ncbi:uncharacterized protein DMENIID0001_157250 [Sergentomyia squamirostris]
MTQLPYIVLFLYLGQSLAQKSITLVILHEEQEKNIPNMFGSIFKEVEQQYGNEVIISDRYLPINFDGDNLDQQLCALSTEGVSAVINLLWRKLEDVPLFFKSQAIIYAEADLSVFPFVQIAERYLRKQSATDCVFIVTSENEVDQVLFGMIGTTNLRIIVLNDLSANSIDKLQKIRPYPSYYAVIATTDKMNEIFNIAMKFRLLKKPDKWILVFTDAKDETFRYHSTTKDVTKLTVDSSFCCRWIKQSDGCACPSGFSYTQYFLKEIIDKMVTYINVNNVQKVTVKCTTDNSTEIATYQNFAISNIINNNNQMIYAFPESDEIRFRLNATIHSTETPYADEEVVTVGRYVDGEILNNVGTSLSRPTKRFFRIGTTPSVPWTFHLGRDAEGKDLWSGYCVELIDFIAKRMNFDYEIVSPTRGTFGRNEGNGKWDGLVGDLMTGEIDIAVAAMKMTAEREEVIDFVAPYFEQTGITIVLRKPVRQTSLFKFMTVLRLEVWLSIVAALVATAILIWFLDKYSPYSARNNKEAYPYPCRDFTLKESFWFALTSFTPQGGGEAPKALSGRTLVAAYWLFVVLMLATFTANLAAFLTVERMQTPVQSLEQLARQSRINYTVVEGSDTHSYFINMKFAEDTLYRVWKEITLNSTSDQSQYRVWDYPIKEQYGNILLAINSTGPVISAEEGFREVNEHINADFAFIHDSAEIKYEISRSCNLTEVGEEFGKQPYALAVQQGSHIQDELSITILELQKDRVFENLKAKYWNSSAKGQCTDDDENEGISLESLGGVFIATLVGLAISLITLAGEVFYYKRKNKTAIIEVQPFEATTKDNKTLQKNLQNLTFGDDFIPAGTKPISHISVYPRKSIHEYGDYIE